MSLSERDTNEIQNREVSDKLKISLGGRSHSKSNENQRKLSVRFLKNHPGKELNAHDGQLMNLICLENMVGGFLEKRNRFLKKLKKLKNHCGNEMKALKMYWTLNK